MVHIGHHEGMRKNDCKRSRSGEFKWTDKEEEKKNWLGLWLRRNCLLKDPLEGNGTREEGSRQKKISDDR